MPTPKDSKNKKYGKSVIEDFNPIIKEYTKKRGRPKGSKTNSDLLIKGPSKSKLLHEVYSNIPTHRKLFSLCDPTPIEKINLLTREHGIILVRDFNELFLLDIKQNTVQSL